MKTVDAAKLRLFFAPAIVVAAVAAGLLPLLAFAIAEGGGFFVDGYIWRVLYFTLLQAGLSTLLSIALALPAARALASRQFFGRNVLMVLFAVPQALPAIVVVLALVELYGNAGWLGGVFPLYGLGGILLAHLFFNVPLAIRFCVEALEQIAPENRRLGQQLGFTGIETWRHVEWPALREMLPRLAALIFLLCAASFVVVLTFGGPAATTLEVAIYQSLRLDFDVSRAVSLALLQMALCLALAFAVGRMATPLPMTTRLRHTVPLTVGIGWQGATSVVLVSALVVPPLFALFATGILQITWRPNLVSAFATSVFIALVSACLAVALAWPIARLQVTSLRGRGFVSTIALFGIVVPPAVLATGWFLIMRGSGTGIALSVFLISCLNALMALPFSSTLLSSAMAAVLPHHDRLCTALGVSGLSRLWRIDRLALSRPLAQAFLVAFVLSFGDLTAVMLLGSQGLVTLPALIAAEMGQYRVHAAQGTALLLASLCLAGAALAHRVGRSPEGQS